jgi:hypothetical protein
LNGKMIIEQWAGRDVEVNDRGIILRYCPSISDACYRSDQNLLSSRLLSQNVKIKTFFFPMALQPPMGPWPTSMKLSVSLRFS